MTHVINNDIANTITHGFSFGIIAKDIADGIAKGIAYRAAHGIAHCNPSPVQISSEISEISVDSYAGEIICSVCFKSKAEH